MNKPKKQSKKMIVGTEPPKAAPTTVGAPKSLVAKAQPVKTAVPAPEPVKAAVPKPEPVKTVPAAVEPAKSSTLTAPPVRPEPAKVMTSVAHTVKTEPAPPPAMKAEFPKPAVARPEPVRAPVRTPNRVSLRLERPGAKQVCVAGSFNGWKPEQTPLVPKGNGLWVGDLAVPAGRHEYLFVVDGQWVLDPNAKETVQNPFGGKNAVLLVGD